MLRKIFCFVLLLAITACASPAPDVTPTPGETPTPPASHTPTALLAETVTPETGITATPGDENPQLVLPTPGAEPVSAWRPPLYPVPWSPTSVDHFYLNRPIAADEFNAPVEDYRYGGMFTGTKIIHTGIDIPASYGTPVLAAGDGTVVWAGWGLYSGVKENKKDPYGQAIVVRHDFGHDGQRLYTVYAHLSQINVTRGQWVKSGEPIGELGDTGLTSGPHLHFELRFGENDYFSTYNPELWLVPPQGWGVLVGRVTDGSGYPLHDQVVIVDSLDADRRWRVHTYGPNTVLPDPYYNENMVLSDLPAGKYRIMIQYLGSYLDHEIEIKPGLVTYFSFKGYKGYYEIPPPLPGLEGLTPVVTP